MYYKILRLLCIWFFLICSISANAQPVSPCEPHMFPCGNGCYDIKYQQCFTGLLPRDYPGGAIICGKSERPCEGGCYNTIYGGKTCHTNLPRQLYPRGSIACNGDEIPCGGGCAKPTQCEGRQGVGATTTATPTPTVSQSPAATCASPTVLFNNWNTGGCNLTQIARGQLTQNSIVTKLVFWSNTGIDGGQITMQMNGPGISQTITTKRGNCQGPWCEGIVNLQKSLSAGVYTFTANSNSLCQNGATGGIGYVRFEGCAASASVDPCAGHVRTSSPFDECNRITNIRSKSTAIE